MDLTYKDKSYIRVALSFYLKHLQKYEEDDEGVTEDEFTEIQNDVMNLDNLLYEFEQEIKHDKSTTGSGAKLYKLPSKE